MMKTKTTKMWLLALSLCLSIGATAQQLAFPEAQGWGRFATGGRTGKVYHVTNLNDSGTGSLRDAVSQANRIIVFDVAGVIRLNSRLVFKINLYVAGQTAPGEGITVYGDGVSFSGADNIIVRYMRFRMGTVGTKDKDCAGIANGQNMIFDHCSFAWGQDENFSINWDNKGTAPTNITLMNSIVGQGLMTHSAGGLMQADNITLYRILLCDNSTRNFKVKGINQYVNNIVYNWKNAAYNMGGDSQGTSYVNIEGNLFINGPAGGGNGLTGGNSDFHFYGNDNWQDDNKDGVYNPVEFTGDGGGDRQAEPYDYPELEKWQATQLIDKLLPDVGASLPYRDLTDCYMIDEVKSFGTKGALITKETELFYGTPDTWTVYKGEAKEDTDGDGMPDDWEAANGTNLNVDDAMVIADNGYANIENYINSITRNDRDEYLRAPLAPSLVAATPSSLTIGWYDFTDNEDGFIVEMKKNGTFVEIGRTKANVSQFVYDDASLTPATAYTVRLCAYNNMGKSTYTSELTVKTRPEPVDIVDVDNFEGDDTDNWLIAPTEDETITLTEATEKKAVVVRSDANVTIGGTGYISGSASMNKTGNGVLTIASDQRYTGPTVLHQGTYEFASLKNGGVASGLGASQEFAQNWIMNGGTYRYTGASTATNRSAQLYNDAELDIADKNAVVTMNGSFEGAGDLTIGGEGQLLVNTGNVFKHDGSLIVKGGLVKLANKEISTSGIGTASKLVMAGGSFQTVGLNEANVDYNFPIEAVAGTTSTVDIDLWSTIKCDVSGSGTLVWNVHYIREYLEGNWDNFTGQLIVNGTGKVGQSQLAMSKSDLPYGIKNATLYLKGNAQVVGSKNQATRYLGGLSGDKGTFLSGFDVKSKGGKGTWVVGSANTNEEFAGVIDNRAQGGQEGTTSLQKVGTGDWRLTGSNVYSGTTDVNGGAFIVNGTNSGTGKVTVNSGATLAGTGSIAGAVQVANGGTIQAGDTLVNGNGLTLSGLLSVANGATVRIPATATASNKLTLKAKAALGTTVTLCLSDEGFDEAPYDSTEYQLFDFAGGSLTGTFAEIVPATPGEGQEWDTSELYDKGILRVLGGEKKPDGPTPGPGPEEPVGDTQKVCLAWGNMTPGSYDNSGVNNMLTGIEKNETHDNTGFSMVCTGNLTKAYSSADKPKFIYEFDGVQRTAIKLSNGAQNTIFLPEGARVTKLTLWSVVGTNSSSRTSYWKEVAGQNYTEETATILDLDAPRTAPNRVDFTLNNVANAITFTNTGEQQCIIIVMEYHYGGPVGITTAAATAAPLRVDYYTLSGERVATPGHGLYIVRITTAEGKTLSRKVVR